VVGVERFELPTLWSQTGDSCSFQKLYTGESGKEQLEDGGTS